MDSPLNLVQQLNQELSSKEMIISKKNIQLSKVVGQGISTSAQGTINAWVILQIMLTCVTQESQD